ncbi:MAG: MBOAT family O-acyltransferase [Vicinamibacterales bacterium]
MVFSSYLFVFYLLPLALGAYYLAPLRVRNFVLTAFSYLFYGWANPLFLFLLLGSTLLDYTSGLLIARSEGERIGREYVIDPAKPRSRRATIILAISIVTNLSLLGFFKYFNFGVENYDALIAWIGLPELRLDTALRVTLPLGISFYTFESMSYVIDVYRGQARAIRNIVDFAAFVSMFPQLVAGPIIRFSEIADQIRSRTHTITKFSRGVAFLSLGMAKKVLLANPCGKVADLAFESGSLTLLDAWYGVLAYAFQIYFDFSGYSDMAIGLGLMMGFVFAKNFDSPYTSQSITEFWRRWHISLSTCLRDYLYLPLGGNRKGRVRTYVNLMAVMLIGGLWHGASWTFLVWGGIHGALLAFERMLGKAAPYGRLPAPLRVGLTFIIVLVSWVFFRATSLSSAVDYLSAMVGLGEAQPAALLLNGVVYQPYYLGTIVLAGIVTWTCPQTWDWTRTLTAPKAVVTASLFVVAMVALTTQAYNPFIYFFF